MHRRKRKFNKKSYCSDYIDKSAVIRFSILIDDCVVITDDFAVLLVDVKTGHKRKEFNISSRGTIRNLYRDMKNHSAFAIINSDNMTYIIGSKIESTIDKWDDPWDPIILYHEKLYFNASQYDLVLCSEDFYKPLMITEYPIDGFYNPIACSSSAGVFILDRAANKLEIFLNDDASFAEIGMIPHKDSSDITTLVAIDDKIYGFSDNRHLLIASLSSSGGTKLTHVMTDIVQSAKLFDQKTLVHYDQEQCKILLFDIRTFKNEVGIHYADDVISIDSLNGNILIRTDEVATILL